MKPAAKSLLKSALVLAALGAGIWMVVSETRGLFRNHSSNRVWFYDESEKKLYAMPDTTMPPDKGIGGPSGDGVRAIVVQFGKDKHERKIAYLQKYTPELKKTLDASILARTAGKIFDGSVPPRQSAYFQGNTLVRLVDETDWHPANSPEGKQVVQVWRSWHDADGSAPRVCSAD